MIADIHGRRDAERWLWRGDMVAALADAAAAGRLVAVVDRALPADLATRLEAAGATVERLAPAPLA